MVRLVIRWLDSPWAYEVRPGLNKLGRNPTNDFRLSDPSVSSFHAELMVESGIIRVRDLGSTNGTFIDDQKIEESVVKPENVLRLGNIRLKLEEVVVTPVCPVPTSNSPQIPELNLVPQCAYHENVNATYRCQNCAGAFCAACVTVVGQSRTGATTVCPLCKGQCYELPSYSKGKGESAVAAKSGSFMNRLTQTLRIYKK